MTKSVEQIITLLKQGETDRAVALLEEHGGPMFGFIHGYEALNRLVDATREEALLGHQVLLSCYCFTLVKAGRSRRATAILHDRRNTFTSPVLRDLIELAVFIHTGDRVTRNQLSRWTRLEGHLPVGNPLQDGLYYNCMLIVLIRLNQLVQARTLALRALESYRQAENPGLEFYIHLHLAQLSVLEGKLRTARREVRMASELVQENELAHACGATLVEIVESAIAWESGQPTPGPERLAALRRDLLTGDSWAEIFIELCRVGAYSIYFRDGLSAAVEFLNESQADFHRRHGEFSDAIDVIAAAIELLDGRPEHAQHYVARPFRRADDLGATGTIVLKAIAGKLDADADVGRLTPDTGTMPRFSVMDELIKASKAREERDRPRQRRHVQSAMRLAINDGLTGLFLEHREAVLGVSSQLASGRFARGHIQLSRMANRVHKAVRGSYLTPTPLSKRGITAQQMRVLTALRDGASNKQIARKLGLTESAIKYHLGRLLTVFEVRKRGQLIEKLENIEITS